MPRTTRVAVVLAALALVASACAGSRESPFQATLEWDDCPPDVSVTFLSSHECGYLTVLEDRAEPGGDTIRLLVVMADPVGVEPLAGVVGHMGMNVGDRHQDIVNVNLASIATGTRRVAVGMEHRGAARYSEPSLACPEADGLAERAAATVTGDPGLTAAFVEAVEACATRLRSDGIEPANFDLAAVVADREDLRVALGLDEWYALGSYGTASWYAFEYIRTHPDRVGAAYVDSPWFPDIDELTGGVLGVRAGLRQLFETCAADPDCARYYPDLEETWEAALGRLSRSPLVGEYESAEGHVVEVVVDAGKLLRVARFTLGDDGPRTLRQLPAIISAAADGVMAPQLLSIVANDPLFCVGYRPLCSGQVGREFSLGVYLTAFCRYQLPHLDQARLAAAIDGDLVYEAVFGASPYVAACEVWDVPVADPATVAPVDGAVPMLFLPGQFDSYGPPDWADERVAGLEHAWSVTLPGGTHNAIAHVHCGMIVRNAWAASPATPPDPAPCEAAAPQIQFTPPIGAAG